MSSRLVSTEADETTKHQDLLAEVYRQGAQARAEGKAAGCSYEADDLREAWQAGWISAENTETGSGGVALQLKDLQLVEKPDGTVDVWACREGTPPSLLGPASHQSLAPAVEQYRAWQREEQQKRAHQVSQEMEQQRVREQRLEHSYALGDLGRVIQALQATGERVSMTIELGGAE